MVVGVGQRMPCAGWRLKPRLGACGRKARLRGLPESVAYGPVATWRRALPCQIALTRDITTSYGGWPLHR